MSRYYVEVHILTPFNVHIKFYVQNWTSGDHVLTLVAQCSESRGLCPAVLHMRHTRDPTIIVIIYYS